MKHMDRKSKEKQYIVKMTELQLRWHNPIDGDWNFIKEWADEKLDSELKDTIGQLRFEKTISFLWRALKYSFYTFILLGVIGLLLFGIRQLF